MDPCSTYRQICMAWVGGAQCGINAHVDVPEVCEFANVLLAVPVPEPGEVPVGAGLACVLRSRLSVHLEHSRQARSTPAFPARDAGCSADTQWPLPATTGTRLAARRRQRRSAVTDDTSRLRGSNGQGQRRRSPPTRSGVYGSHRRAASSSKPTVCASTYAAVDPARARSARAASAFISARFVPMRGSRGGRRPRAPTGVGARVDDDAAAAGPAPRRRSSIRDQSTVCGLGDVVAPRGRSRRSGRRPCRSRAGRRVPKVSFSAVAGRGRAEPRVAVHVRRAEPAFADHRERVVLLQEQLAAACRSRSAPQPPASERAARERSTTRPIAVVPVGLDAARRRARISGRVSRSADVVAPATPNRSFGPSRPWLTRSAARPRTPTMRPSLTAMSSPQPFEHSTHAEVTQRSTSSGSIPVSS